MAGSHEVGWLHHFLEWLPLALEECHHYLLAVAELATQLGGALEVTSELEDRVSDLQRQNDSLRR